MKNIREKLTVPMVSLAAMGFALLLGASDLRAECCQGACPEGKIEYMTLSNGKLHCANANACDGLTTAEAAGGNIELSACAPVCGNGVIEAGEACDGAAVGDCTDGCDNCQCAPPC